MKKAVITILIVIVVLLAGIFLYAGLAMPKDFRITRSIVIQAPAAKIFPYVNNHKLMNTWNPWMKLDPDVKVTYSGPEEGVGAVSEWHGNRNVGAGRATITRSSPGFLVRMDMDWFEPMKGTSTVDFSLKQLGENTTVEWIMMGQNHLLSRVMCIFMDMDKMVGGQFEIGLNELKSMVDKN